MEMRNRVIDFNDLLGSKYQVCESLVEFDLLVWSLTHTLDLSNQDDRDNEMLVDTCLFWANYHYEEMVNDQAELTEFIVNIVNAKPEFSVQTIEDEIQMFLAMSVLHRRLR